MSYWNLALILETFLLVKGEPGLVVKIWKKIENFGGENLEVMENFAGEKIWGGFLSYNTPNQRKTHV